MTRPLSPRRYRRGVSPKLPVAALAAPAVVLAAGALLSGCASKSAFDSRPHIGSATASAAADGVQEITLRAGDTYRFEPATVYVHPGKVRVVLTNIGKGAPHTWSLQGFPAAFVPLASSGQTKTVTFDAPEPGTYTFFCTLHQRQGQTGKLVVLSN